MASKTSRRKALGASEAAAAADALLQEIVQLQLSLKSRHEIVASKIEEIKAVNQPFVDAITSRLEQAEKALLDLAKRSKETLFSKRDRVDLPHGSVLHQVETKVRKARGVLDAMQQLLDGAEQPEDVVHVKESIKIALSVDWDRLETWTDEQLAAVGTERKRKDLFTYEVKNDPDGTSKERAPAQSGNESQS